MTTAARQAVRARLVACSVVPGPGSPRRSAPARTGAAGHAVSGLPDGGVPVHGRVPPTTPATRASAAAGLRGGRDAARDHDRLRAADGATTTATALTWDFIASEPGSTFACRVYPAALDAGAFRLLGRRPRTAAAGFLPGTYPFEAVATGRRRQRRTPTPAQTHVHGRGCARPARGHGRLRPPRPVAGVRGPLAAPVVSGGRPSGGRRHARATAITSAARAHAAQRGELGQARPARLDGIAALPARLLAQALSQAPRARHRVAEAGSCAGAG